MGKVTREDVEKAKGKWEAVESKAQYVATKAESAADAAWDKYIELKEAYENGK